MIFAVGFVLLLIPFAIVYCIYHCAQEMRQARKDDAERLANYEKLRSYKGHKDDDEHTCC